MSRRFSRGDLADDEPNAEAEGKANGHAGKGAARGSGGGRAAKHDGAGEASSKPGSSAAVAPVEDDVDAEPYTAYTPTQPDAHAPGREFDMSALPPAHPVVFFARHFGALFAKRFHYARRDSKMVFFQVRETAGQSRATVHGSCYSLRHPHRCGPAWSRLSRAPVRRRRAPPRCFVPARCSSRSWRWRSECGCSDRARRPTVRAGSWTRPIVRTRGLTSGGCARSRAAPRSHTCRRL